MKNKQARQMIEDCITKNYGGKVAEWRSGSLMKTGWHLAFKQGFVYWFGMLKDIK